MNADKKPPTQTYVRRRAFNKIHVTSWLIYLEKDGYVRCSFQNCNFMAFDVEEMCNHFGYCKGDNSCAEFVCERCNGRTDTLKKLHLHLARAHNVESNIEPPMASGSEIEVKYTEPSKPSRVLVVSWGYFFEKHNYIKCLNCCYLANSLSEMCKHYPVCKQELENLLYVCPECKGRTFTVNPLLWHLEKCHKIFKAPSQFNHITKAMVQFWEKEIEDKGIASCLHIVKGKRDCYYFDFDVLGIIIHSQCCKGPQFQMSKEQCPHCPRWTGTLDKLWQHINRSHTDQVEKLQMQGQLDKELLMIISKKTDLPISASSPSNSINSHHEQRYLHAETATTSGSNPLYNEDKSVSQLSPENVETNNLECASTNGSTECNTAETQPDNEVIVSETVKILPEVNKRKVSNLNKISIERVLTNTTKHEMSRNESSCNNNSNISLYLADEISKENDGSGVDNIHNQNIDVQEEGEMMITDSSAEEDNKRKVFNSTELQIIELDIDDNINTVVSKVNTHSQNKTLYKTAHHGCDSNNSSERVLLKHSEAKENTEKILINSSGDKDTSHKEVQEGERCEEINDEDYNGKRNLNKKDTLDLQEQPSMRVNTQANKKIDEQKRKIEKGRKAFKQESWRVLFKDECSTDEEDIIFGEEKDISDINEPAVDFEPPKETYEHRSPKNYLKRSGNKSVRFSPSKPTSMSMQGSSYIGATKYLKDADEISKTVRHLIDEVTKGEASAHSVSKENTFIKFDQLKHQMMQTGLEKCVDKGNKTLEEMSKSSEKNDKLLDDLTPSKMKEKNSKQIKYLDCFSKTVSESSFPGIGPIEVVGIQYNNDVILEVQNISSEKHFESVKIQGLQINQNNAATISEEESNQNDIPVLVETSDCNRELSSNSKSYSFKKQCSDYIGTINKKNMHIEFEQLAQPNHFRPPTINHVNNTNLTINKHILETKIKVCDIENEQLSDQVNLHPDIEKDVSGRVFEEIENTSISPLDDPVESDRAINYDSLEIEKIILTRERRRSTSPTKCEDISLSRVGVLSKNKPVNPISDCTQVAFVYRGKLNKHLIKNSLGEHLKEDCKQNISSETKVLSTSEKDAEESAKVLSFPNKLSDSSEILNHSNDSCSKREAAVIKNYNVIFHKLSKQSNLISDGTTKNISDRRVSSVSSDLCDESSQEEDFLGTDEELDMKDHLFNGFQEMSDTAKCHNRNFHRFLTRLSESENEEWYVNAGNLSMDIRKHERLLRIKSPSRMNVSFPTESVTICEISNSQGRHVNMLNKENVTVDCTKENNSEFKYDKASPVKKESIETDTGNNELLLRIKNKSSLYPSGDCVLEDVNTNLTNPQDVVSLEQFNCESANSTSSSSKRRRGRPPKKVDQVSKEEMEKYVATIKQKVINSLASEQEIRNRNIENASNFAKYSQLPSSKMIKTPVQSIPDSEMAIVSNEDKNHMNNSVEGVIQSEIRFDLQGVNNDDCDYEIIPKLNKKDQKPGGKDFILRKSRTPNKVKKPDFILRVLNSPEIESKSEKFKLSTAISEPMKNIINFNMGNEVQCVKKNESNDFSVFEDNSTLSLIQFNEQKQFCLSNSNVENLPTIDNTSPKDTFTKLENNRTTDDINFNTFNIGKEVLIDCSGKEMIMSGSNYKTTDSGPENGECTIAEHTVSKDSIIQDLSGTKTNTENLIAKSTSVTVLNCNKNNTVNEIDGSNQIKNNTTLETCVNDSDNMTIGEMDDTNQIENTITLDTFENKSDNMTSSSEYEKGEFSMIGHTDSKDLISQNLIVSKTNTLSPESENEFLAVISSDKNKTKNEIVGLNQIKNNTKVNKSKNDSDNKTSRCQSSDSNKSVNEIEDSMVVSGFSNTCNTEIQTNKFGVKHQPKIEKCELLNVESSCVPSKKKGRPPKQKQGSSVTQNNTTEILFSAYSDEADSILRTGFFSTSKYDKNVISHDLSICNSSVLNNRACEYSNTSETPAGLKSVLGSNVFDHSGNAPVPRKRGRPPKIKLNQNINSVRDGEINSSQSNHSFDLIHNKRELNIGKPTNLILNESVESKLDSSDVHKFKHNCPMPKKRGRPPKIKLNNSNSSFTDYHINSSLTDMSLDCSEQNILEKDSNCDLTNPIIDNKSLGPDIESSSVHKQELNCTLPKKRGRPPKIKLNSSSLTDNDINSSVNNMSLDSICIEQNLLTKDGSCDLYNPIFDNSQSLGSEIDNSVHKPENDHSLPKKRGRPPKIKQNVNNTCVTENDINSSVGNSSIGTKSNDNIPTNYILDGRQGPEIANSLGNGTENKMLKKRGRPPKIKLNISNSSVTNSHNNSSINTNSIDTKFNENNISIKSNGGKPTNILDGIQGPGIGNYFGSNTENNHSLPKRRGRPPKIKLNISNSSVSDLGSVLNSTFIDTAGSNNLMPRKRGRRPKLKHHSDFFMNQQKNARKESISAERNTVVDKSLLPKKRGRPPKLRINEGQGEVSKFTEVDGKHSCGHSDRKEIGEIPATSSENEFSDSQVKQRKRRRKINKKTNYTLIDDEQLAQFSETEEVNCNESYNSPTRNQLLGTDIILINEEKLNSSVFSKSTKFGQRSSSNKGNLEHLDLKGKKTSKISKIKGFGVRKNISPINHDKCTSDSYSRRKRKLIVSNDCNISCYEDTNLDSSKTESETIHVKRKRRRMATFEEYSDNDNEDDSLSDEEPVYKPKRSIKRKNASITKPADSLMFKVKHDANDKVICGACKQEMTYQVYRYNHAIYKHYMLTWLDGEEDPLDMDNAKDVVNRLWHAKKKIGKTPFKCFNCNLPKLSAVGFQSHIRFCGKVGKEKESLMVTCDICGARMMPSSFRAHMYIKHKTPCEEDNCDLDKSVIIPKAKRAAASRAVEVIIQSQKDDDGQDDPSARPASPDSKQMSHLYLKPNKSVPHEEYARWKKSLQEQNIVICTHPDCGFSADSTVAFRKHYFSCPLLAQTQEKVYRCKKCNFVSKTEQQMQDHIMEKHEFMLQQLSSESDSSDCSDEDLGKGSKYWRHMPQNSYSNLPFKFLRGSSSHTKMRGGPRKYFFSPALQWTMDMRKVNLSKEILFNGATFSDCKYVPLSSEMASQYMPQVRNSVKFRTKDGSWHTLRRFEGTLIDGVPVVFAGGPIWAAAWAPVPDTEYQQFLALAPHPNMEITHEMSSIYSYKSLIQIWNFGYLTNTDPHSGETPNFLLGLAHSRGAVWSLKWCPSGCNLDSRLGLLAAACSDGSISIYSVPRYRQTFESVPEHTIYDVEPVIELKLGCEMLTQCTCIDWHSVAPHSMIIGGFANGMVAIWDLNTTSPLLKDGITLFPFKVIEAHLSSVSAVSLSPTLDNMYFMTASLDRATKFWRLEDTTVPVNAIRKASVIDAAMPSNWLTSISAYDDVFSINSSHITGYSYRETFCSTNTNYLLQCGTVWSVSFSDWLNACACASEIGKLTVFFRKQILVTEDSKKIKKNSMVGDLITCSVQPLNDKTTVQQFGNYNDCVNNVGLELDIKENMAENSKPKPACSSDMMDSYPIASLNKVTWNPNFNSFLWLAAGLQCGLVIAPRIQCIPGRELSDLYKHKDDR